MADHLPQISSIECDSPLRLAGKSMQPPSNTPDRHSRFERLPDVCIFLEDDTDISVVRISGIMSFVLLQNAQNNVLRKGPRPSECDCEEPQESFQNLVAHDFNGIALPNVESTFP